MKKIMICLLVICLLMTGCIEKDRDKSVQLLEVSSGKINSDGKENQEKIDEVWKRINLIVPKDYMEKISVFEIVDSKENGDTASVAPNDEQWRTWLFSVNFADIYDGNELKSDINATLIHEFAHILSLEHSQHRKEDEDLSNQYAYESAVLSRDSYLDKFYQKFWLDIIDEQKSLLGEEKYSEEKLENLMSFYDTYQNQFVSDYAAFNPMEDFAESFYMFVLNDQPIGDLIKDQKVKFFYEFPELVSMRDDIRRSISKNGG